MNQEIKIFNNTEEIATEFALLMLNLLKNADGKPIHIALSGGSTPKAMFKVLNEKFGTQLYNKQFHFWWGDDRCVPPTHDESNYKWANELWLQSIGYNEKNIHRVKGENNSEEETLRYEKEIQNHLPIENNLPTFDIMLLGLGEDGHTASIFPYQIDFLNSKNICEVATHPYSGQKRITITGQTINNSKNIIFLATGAKKAEKIHEVVTLKKKNLPATGIKANNGDLFWWIDTESASMINT